ncbi:MAG: type II toxin-antitoxin system VapC family toxin [Lautropia sp.]|nr:type II toxin-antitoxin system VapC family toxin [Lautropia sp.]
MNTYMLDTNICSFIMRKIPATVLQRLAEAKNHRHRLVISSITYAEMRYGQIGKKASPHHKVLIDEFVARLDNILPWDRHAVDATITIKQALNLAGTPIGPNDCAIAGHAMATGCILVSNNTREFQRISGIQLEDWV